ncbi:MAG: hypothetical protein LM559_05195 [Pyrobaculum sp.]|nr:hypothetical protein [Pyrobaculum sp.]
MSPPVVFIFRYCPPPHLMALAKWGFSVASLSRCPGVEHVADVKTYIERKFVIIVGDRRLAEELGVGHATVAEVEKFLRWLSKEVPAVYKPYMQ